MAKDNTPGPLAPFFTKSAWARLYANPPKIEVRMDRYDQTYWLTHGKRYDFSYIADDLHQQAIDQCAKHHIADQVTIDDKGVGSEVAGCAATGVPYVKKLLVGKGDSFDWWAYGWQMGAKAQLWCKEVWVKAYRAISPIETFWFQQKGMPFVNYEMGWAYGFEIITWPMKRDTIHKDSDLGLWLNFYLPDSRLLRPMSTLRAMCEQYTWQEYMADLDRTWHFQTA